jgi:hypothetical protein
MKRFWFIDREKENSGNILHGGIASEPDILDGSFNIIC